MSQWPNGGSADCGYKLLVLVYDAVSINYALMVVMNALTRFTVLDASDRFVGTYYAHTEVAAISAAIKDGYDAWSTTQGRLGVAADHINSAVRGPVWGW